LSFTSLRHHSAHEGAGRLFPGPGGVITYVRGNGTWWCEDRAVSEEILSRARAGDQDAFGELVEPHRRELQVHCYRILGSVPDAEDMVQETLLAAWRGLEGFEGRASVRAWLYRIATNRCLNALRDSGRRPPPARPSGRPEPTRWGEPVWLEPYPDVLLEGIADAAPGPEARYESRETIELAFITALQHLPPRQRAVLVLRDVLGFRTAEAADMLDGTEDSVKGALKRARATLEERLPATGRPRPPAPRSPQERALVRRFTDAFQAGDIDGLVALLTDDAWLTMPPVPLEYQGPPAIASFLRHWAAARGARRFRLVPTRANTQPAFGLYLSDEHATVARAAGLIVLTLYGDRIAAVTFFPDTSVLPRFGLPRTLPAGPRP
jgi:RNA polymerase sigma-70 factor (ECF subfamily)